MLTMTNQTAQDIGHRIERERKRAGLTQQELGDGAGVTRAYISMLEAGKNFPSVKTLTRLSTALDVPVSLLVDAEEL